MSEEVKVTTEVTPVEVKADPPLAGPIEVDVITPDSLTQENIQAFTAKIVKQTEIFQRKRSRLEMEHNAHALKKAVGDWEKATKDCENAEHIAESQEKYGRSFQAKLEKLAAEMEADAVYTEQQQHSKKCRKCGECDF